MNVTRFILAFIAVSVFIVGLEYLVHAVWLAEDYAATAELWRPAESFPEYAPYMLASQIIQAFLIAYIFTRHYEAKGLGEGLRYGLYVGLLLAALNLGMYAWLPVGLALVGSWMGAAVVKGVGAGAVLALVYKA